MNGDGTYAWHTEFGAGCYSSCRVGSVHGLQDGSVTVAGVMSNVSWDGPDGTPPLYDDGELLVQKFDENGTYLWHLFLGYGDSNWPLLHTTADDGGIYLVGMEPWGGWDGPNQEPPLNEHRGNPINWMEQEDMSVVKLSPEGTYEWHAFYGSGQYADEAQSLETDSQGSLIVAAQVYAGFDGPGQLVLIVPFVPLNEPFAVVYKVTADGTGGWYTNWGTRNSWGDNGTDIAIGADDSIYVTGSSTSSWLGPKGQKPLTPWTDGMESNVVLMKLSPEGEYIWHAFWGISKEANGVSLGSDGTIILSGFTGDSWNGPDGQEPLNPNEEDGGDAFILKLIEEPL